MIPSSGTEAGRFINPGQISQSKLYKLGLTLSPRTQTLVNYAALLRKLATKCDCPRLFCHAIVTGLRYLNRHLAPQL